MRNRKTIFALLISLSIFAGCSKKDDAERNDSLKTGLHVKDGQYLADDCGNKIILRGVNLGSIYAINSGMKELEEIEKTGANAVRIVLTQQYQDWNNGGTLKALESTLLESLITSCIDKGMIPVLELHDFTGTGNVLTDLPKAVQWWTKADIKAVLIKHQKSIILNIANEPDNGTAHITSYNTANLIAVKDLRTAGIICPIMIDAPNWGKDHTFFIEKGQALQDSDPLHNLIFSVHAYWPTAGAFGNYSDAQITTTMTSLGNSGLPVVIGELAQADIQNNIAYAINYKLLMKLCQEKGLGYMVWWWGFYENPGANNQLSMTNDGLYTGLQGAGKIMAVEDANSIQKTSKKVCR
jgi:mannan endo-1,4-beta-mannosidase